MLSLLASISLLLASPSPAAQVGSEVEAPVAPPAVSAALGRQLDAVAPLVDSPDRLSAALNAQAGAPNADVSDRVAAHLLIESVAAPEGLAAARQVLRATPDVAARLQDFSKIFQGNAAKRDAFLSSLSGLRRSLADLSGAPDDLRAFLDAQYANARGRSGSGGDVRAEDNPSEEGKIDLKLAEPTPRSPAPAWAEVPSPSDSRRVAQVSDPGFFQRFEKAGYKTSRAPGLVILTAQSGGRIVLPDERSGVSLTAQDWGGIAQALDRQRFTSQDYFQPRAYEAENQAYEREAAALAASDVTQPGFIARFKALGYTLSRSPGVLTFKSAWGDVIALPDERSGISLSPEERLELQQTILAQRNSNASFVHPRSGEANKAAFERDARETTRDGWIDSEFVARMKALGYKVSREPGVLILKTSWGEEIVLPDEQAGIRLTETQRQELAKTILAQRNSNARFVHPRAYEAGKAAYERMVNSAMASASQGQLIDNLKALGYEPFREPGVLVFDHDNGGSLILVDRPGPLALAPEEAAKLRKTLLDARHSNGSYFDPAAPKTADVRRFDDLKRYAHGRYDLVRPLEIGYVSGKREYRVLALSVYGGFAWLRALNEIPPDWRGERERGAQLKDLRP